MLFSSVRPLQKKKNLHQIQTSHFDQDGYQQIKRVTKNTLQRKDDTAD